MSSSTEINYEPVEYSPPPPPEITTEMQGYQAGSATGVLGVSGCQSLVALLETLADSTFPARTALGELLDADTHLLNQLLSWKRGKSKGDFVIELPESALIEDAQRLGVGSVTVHLRIGESLLETRFQHTVKRTQRIEPSEQHRMIEAIQRSANRAVNASIAVLATESFKRRVTATVKQEFRNTVQARVSQHAIRIQARAQLRHRVVSGH